MIRETLVYFFDQEDRMTTVTAYEAKTHLPRLIRAVERGETVIITRHGKPVAQLTPIGVRREQVLEAIEDLKRLRSRLPKISVDEIIASIHEGHKY
jgi:prevent-host-death family protein